VGNFKTNRRKCSVPGTWRVGDTLRARLGTRLSCIMRLLHRQKAPDRQKQDCAHERSRLLRHSRVTLKCTDGRTCASSGTQLTLEVTTVGNRPGSWLAQHGNAGSDCGVVVGDAGGVLGPGM
jgi:hypothetical protein